jgi:hypothetical protein
VAIRSKPVQADARIEWRADPASKDFGGQREPPGSINPEMVEINLVAGIQKRIRVRSIVERIGADRS